MVRNFDVGEYVLVFRPIRKSKLENQWQGPYIISKKLTESHLPGRFWYLCEKISNLPCELHEEVDLSNPSCFHGLR